MKQKHGRSYKQRKKEGKRRETRIKGSIVIFCLYFFLYLFFLLHQLHSAVPFSLRGNFISSHLLCITCNCSFNAADDLRSGAKLGSFPAQHTRLPNILQDWLAIPSSRTGIEKEKEKEQRASQIRHAFSRPCTKVRQDLPAG